MIVNYDSFQVILLVLSYTIIYNLTALLLFSTLIHIFNAGLKTFFSLSLVNNENAYTKILSLTILSLAGVPPLLGFFSKVFVFLLISNSKLLSLFLPLLVLLLVGLYFYVQNLRFLHSTNVAMSILNLDPSTSCNSWYFLLTLPLAFITVFGFCFVDDLLLISAWVLL